MNKFNGYFIAIVILVTSFTSLSGCYKIGNCIKGNGQVVLEERALKSFNRIVVNGSYEVNVLPGQTHRVVVDAESNLLDFINTRVRGQSLVIESAHNRCLKNSVPIMVNVYTPLVDEIELNGSGLIIAHGLFLEELYVSVNGSGTVDLDVDVDFLSANLNGSGKIDITGIATTTELNITGSGSMYAYQLTQSNCNASISGSGSMYVHVNRKLDAVISGSGTIYYRGNPEVSSSISGSGKLIKQ